ncbi:phage baseplate assembly protein V [Janthinobacterium sp. P210005]|uniref:phage baseplate assembly protein V n=1 Tax=Janthinobacterium sp. P210005 TaxID=3112938 RepID=UPI002E253ED0|nr:phage baseplate assembly protein V [Janthinobacterium sp. P210005]
MKWATRRAGSTRTWSAPTAGEQVIVFSPGGDLTRGIIVPALYSQEFDAPESSPTIHSTHYPDGAVVQHDHATHTLTATLPGGTATITADKVTSNAPSTICTSDLTVMKNLIVMQSTTVEGATTLNGGVNAKAGAAGGVAMAIQGTVKASEDVMAGAISLAKHPHGGVRAGSDQSGRPQPCPGCAGAASPHRSPSVPAPADVFTTAPITPRPPPQLPTDIILAIN